MSDSISLRRGLGTLVVLGGGVAAALVVWSPHGGGGGRTAVPTAGAARGDVVLSVRGVGRIAAAAPGSPVPVPAAQGSPATPGASAAPADAVFAATSGHLARYLVAPGERVSAGRPLAVLGDGGAAAAALGQARIELEAARLELQLKQTSDPTRGLPPSAAELTAARVAVTAARRKVRLLERPVTTEVSAARLELSRAEADLAMLLRAPTPVALAAAERGVGVAYGKLAQASGPLPSAEVLALQQELTRAQADLEALQLPPSATAVAAAQLAVTLAQQRLAELPAGSPPSDVTQARLEVTKAQADLEALQRTPSATAVAAARAAVDLAVARLASATGPPSSLAVASARAELDRARSELQTVRLRAGAASRRAARLAVTLARQKLAQVGRPTATARDGARIELTKALADLDALRRRGGPAGPAEIALARLKVRSAEARVDAAHAGLVRLTVAAPRGGIVTALLSVPGSPVDPTTPIAAVSDLDHLAVDVDLSEFDVARVRRGQAAVVSVDALGGKRYTGSVAFVALTGVQNGGVVTFPVRVGLERLAGVRPGMNVSVRIVVAKRLGVLHVPLEAVAREGKKTTVTVVDAAGTQTTRTVRLGLADNKIVEIRSGLKAGERVLLEAGGGA